MPKKKTNWTNVKNKVEDFFYSDTPAATATKVVLMFIAMSGLVFVGAVIPNVLKALKSFESEGGKKVKYSKVEINNALTGLKRRKFIKIIKDKNGKMKVKLTNKGKKRILELSLKIISIEKPKKWDGKWRIVIFDIPVEKNMAREALRRKMKELGFRQLQKSVWIIPYECEDEILFIAEVFDVEKYVEIITADSLLHGKEIKKAFAL